MRGKKDGRQDHRTTSRRVAIAAAQFGRSGESDSAEKGWARNLHHMCALSVSRVSLHFPSVHLLVSVQ